MTFSPRFTYTHTMVRNLGTIESACAVVEVLPLPLDRALWLRQGERWVDNAPNKPSKTWLSRNTARQLIEIIEDRFFNKPSCAKRITDFGVTPGVRASSGTKV